MYWVCLLLTQGDPTLNNAVIRSWAWVGSEKRTFFHREAEKHRSISKLRSGNSEKEKKKKKKNTSCKFGRAAGTTSSTIGPRVALPKAVS